MTKSSFHRTSASRTVAASLAGLLGVGTATAQFEIPGHTPHRQQTAADVSSVRILTDKSVVEAGETFHLIVFFETEPRWHVYWKNPGEGAAAPDIRITAPEGFRVGNIRWPRPKAKNSPIGELYCYEGPAALFVPVTAPVDGAGREEAIALDVGYAVCDSEKCFFGRGSFRTSIRIGEAGAGDSGEPSRDASFIERHRKRLPEPVHDAANASAELSGSGNSRRLTITGPAHDLNAATFFPHLSPGVRYGTPKITLEDDRFTATIELTINPSNFTRGTPKVGGLVALGTKADDPSYEVEFSLDPSDEAKPE